MARIDLHLHTRYSNGNLTPAEVVALAHRVRITAVAITDHDVVDGVPEAMEAATRWASHLSATSSQVHALTDGNSTSSVLSSIGEIRLSRTI